MKNQLIAKERLRALILDQLGNKGKICEILGITYETLYQHINNDPELALLIEQQIERNIDFVESKLYQMIAGYEEEVTYVSHYKGKIITTSYMKKHKPDPACMIYFLKTRARHRGYVEKTGLDFGGITVDQINFISEEPKLKKLA